MPTVYSQPPGELKLKKDNLLETIQLGKEWQISFEFKAENSGESNYTNILHLTTGEDHTNGVGKIGDRIPAIFYHGGHGLHVTTAIGDKPNYWKHTKSSPPVGKWSTIVVSQLKSGSKINFNFKVDGADHSVENPTPQEFSDVKVYASDPWWNPQSGSIRGLTIKTQ